nr:MAG TPA: Rdx family [Bacteriophage sp.]
MHITYCRSCRYCEGLSLRDLSLRIDRSVTLLRFYYVATIEE